MGVQAYPAAGAASSRQAAAFASMRALDRVERMNLQFAEGWTPFDVPGFEPLTVLRQDSRIVCRGANVARKPLLSELCRTLAREAQRRGCTYFCFTNSDILFTQTAIDEMLERARGGYLFSRMDVDPETGADSAIHLGGVDVIAARPEWWLANDGRFRPFIVGEPLWDQIYTSILMRHADALLFNVRPLVRHVVHPVAWAHTGPMADYNGYLGALDSHYFSLWCEYHAAREAWLLRGGSEDENFRIQREAFTRPWPRGTAVMQPLRGIKAWRRYRRQRAAVDRLTRRGDPGR